MNRKKTSSAVDSMREVMDAAHADGKDVDVSVMRLGKATYHVGTLVEVMDDCIVCIMPDQSHGYVPFDKEHIIILKKV